MKKIYILLIALFFILLFLIWITQDLWDRATNEIKERIKELEYVEIICGR